MVFGLIGTLFNIVTLPGVVADAYVERRIEDHYGAQTTAYAVPEQAEVEGEVDVSDEVRELSADESLRDGESLVQHTDYGRLDDGELIAVFGLPFLTLSALALPFFVCASVGLSVLSDPTPLWQQLSVLGAIWLGVSVGAHAFPNAAVTDAVFDRSQTTDTVLRFVGLPLAGLAKVLGFLEFFWVDALYGLLLFGAVDAVLRAPGA